MLLTRQLVNQNCWKCVCCCFLDLSDTKQRREALTTQPYRKPFTHCFMDPKELMYTKCFETVVTCV